MSILQQAGDLMAEIASSLEVAAEMCIVKLVFSQVSFQSP